MGLRVATMGLDVLSCLEKLHELGFMHQDLKLENICFKNGQYTLIDYGCAMKISY